MSHDALKEYIIEKKRLWQENKHYISFSMNEYKKCIRELKKEVKKDRLLCQKEDNFFSARELDTNLRIFEEVYAEAVSDKKAPHKKTLYICGGLLEDHLPLLSDEASLKESVRLIYEICFSDGFFGDENGREIQRSFFLEGIRLAFLSVKASEEDLSAGFISCIATALKLISEFDFSPFITAFSPVERLWRTINWKEEDIYKISDPKTKALMRSKVRKEALRRGKSEEEFLKEISLLKDPDEKIRELCMKSSSGVPYFSCIAILFLLFSASLLCILMYNGVKTVFSVFSVLITAVPLYSSAKFLTDNIFSRIIPAEPLPKLSESAFLQVREKYPTLVVITSLFASEKDVISTFRSLEKRYLSSEGLQESKEELKPTLYFSILADLPEKTADCEENKTFTEEERSLLEKAEKELSSLNEKYGNIFFLFTRERSLSPDGVYRGWERKRGALLNLSSFLLKKKSEIICAGHNVLPSELEDIKYVLTLDSDTENGFCGIYPLIAAMAHPFNRPEISKSGMKHVSKGTAIIQPAMRTLLSSSCKTPFSIISSGSGLDVYSGPFYDTYQTIFKNGIFCGKGIFDLKVYNEVLDIAFPDNIVLSHDLLEGARLSASFMSEISLYDTTPASACSYMKRASRWIRGDIQALTFAGKYVPTPTGEKKRNPIRKIYRFALYDNVLRALLPVSALLSLFVSLLIPSPFASAAVSLFAVFPYLFPPSVSFLTALLSKNRNPLLRRFLVNTFSSVYRSFLTGAYKISSLAENAYISADSVIRSLYRMKVSKKKLLDWQTFAHTEQRGKEKSLVSYFKNHPLSVILGIVLILSQHNAVSLICGIMMTLFPIVSYYSSVPYDTRIKKISKKQQDTLTEYARDSWKYFEENVNAQTNYLPPDNVAVSPREVTAMRTSPTNIGLFLTSAITAYDMGFLKKEKLFSLLDKALSSIERMKKYKGHLYNWYDIEGLSPLGNFISSVDSGNYCACLICLYGFLMEFKESIPFDLRKRTAALREICDFSVFYNKKRGFLSIGINAATGELDKICYDRYMSESRITSYIACAERQVPSSMWFSLGRTLLESSFFLGCASWSGTCFEYFMPCLFLPTHSEGFTEEALKFAFAHQKKYAFPFPDTKGESVYGVSESCYYSFDEDMNYRYKAFGIPSLALDEEAVREKRHIISPYSSFLMLKMSPDSILNNLAILKNGGMYGKYGFYESVDIKKDKSRIVKCFMSHHIGMSLMACDNFINDGIFRKRFMRDGQMAGAESILGESVPADAPVHAWSKQISHDPSPSEKRQYRTQKRILPSAADHGNEKMTVLNGHNMNAVVSDNGTFFLSTRSKEITDITKRPVCPYTHGGIVLYGSTANEVISSYMTENDKRTFFSSGNSCTLVCQSEKDEKSSVVTLNALLSREMRAAVFSVSSSASEGLKKAGLYIDACADTYESYRSHPAFSSMFLFCKRLTDKGIYLFERRRRDASRSPFFMALGVLIPGNDEDLGAIETESFLRNDLASLSSSPYEASRIIMTSSAKSSSSEKLEYSSVPMMSPEFFLAASIKSDMPKSTPVRKIVFILSCGNTASEAVNIFEKTAEKIKTPFGNETSVFPSEFSPEESIYGSFLLKNTFYKVFFPRLKESISGPVTPFDRNSLWSLGISGDVPMITMRTTDKTPKKDIETLLKLHASHNSAGVIYDLVFSVNETGGYYTAVSSALRSIIEREGYSYMMNSKGGIFIIVNENGSSEMLLRSCSKAFLDELSELQRKEASHKAHALPQKVINSSNENFDDDGEKIPKIGFSPCGYTFDKDKKSSSPYAHVIASMNFGCVVTDSNLGFTWWKNSQQSRLTFWDGGVYSDSFLSESLILETKDPLTKENVRLDLIKCAKRVSYSEGRADYYGSINGRNYKIAVTIHPKLPLKAVKLTFEAVEASDYVSEDRVIKAVYSFAKVPGSIPGGTCVIVSERKDASTAILRTVPFDESVPNLFVKGKGGKTDLIPTGENKAAISITSKLSKRNEMTFFIGAVSSHEHENYISAYTTLNDSEDIFREYKEYISRLIPPTLEKHSFFDFWLPYQAVVCRMNARSGLYQSGGAYGFRDQLQDCLVYLEGCPEYAKRMILKTASRQFEEGDVLHWFHVFTKGGRAVTSGIRSLCSDDYLWLIFVTSEYVEKTQDRDILNIYVPFLTEPELKPSEKERYINDAKQGEKRTLREHLYRAAELFSRRGTGKHSLALMLGGDWNDGMNSIGDNGGESVWLTMFAMICFASLSSLIKHEEPEKAKRLNSAVFEMFEAVNKYGRSEKWFGRAYYGNGTPVGFDTSLKSGCSIDAISQSFAMYVYHRIPFLRNEEFFNFIKLSLNCAYNELFDEELGIVKLFAPPFSRYADKNDVHKNCDPGYIARYPEGMRENGGQYTHGALWLAEAFLLCAEYEKGKEKLMLLERGRKLFNALIPYKKTENHAYMREPYVLCADVYSHKDFPGHGGWSWYTGSAGWMFRIYRSHIDKLKDL